MSINAAAMRMLVDKGFTGEDLVALALCLEKAFPLDATHEKRKAYDRQRKRDGRANSTGHSTGNPPDPAPNDHNTLTPTQLIPIEPSGSKPFAPPSGVSPAQWADFLTVRRTKRAGKMTPTGYNRLCAKLGKLAEDGWPPGEMIGLAVERGWTSVFAPKDFGHEQTNGMGRHQSDGLSPTTRAALAVFGPSATG